MTYFHVCNPFRPSHLVLIMTAGLALSLHNLPSQAAPIVSEPLIGDSYRENTPLTGLNGGSGWNDAWTQQSSAKEGTAVISPAKTISLTADKSDLIYIRNLKQRQSADGTTLWIGFQMQKLSGDRFQGLSLFDQNQEKLFIGAPNGSDNLRLGLTSNTVFPITKWQQILVRIDYRAGTDRALLFVEPSLASIPDDENAVATAQGDFSFDRIRLATGGGNGVSRTRFGPLAIGSNFMGVGVASGATDGGGKVRTGPEAAKPNPVQSWQKTEQGVVVQTAQGTLQLDAFLDGVIHVRYGAEANVKTPAKSYVVLRKPATVRWQLKESTENLILATPQMRAIINRKTGALQFTDASGKILLQEPELGGRDNATSPEFAVRQTFKLSPEEAIYGLGQFRNGGMNWRNRQLELVQFNTQSAIPVLLSTKGYGIFWDNPSRTIFSDTKQGTSFTSDFGNSVNYYVMAGPSFDQIIGQYRQLTGVAPMLPRWAMGYIQSRNRYNSQTQLLEVARRMRQEKIPMDSIFLDYHYWGKYGTGSHQFDESAFPDPKGMVTTLRQELHTHLMATIWPSFSQKSANYATMKSKGYLLEPGRALDGTIYDPFNPEAGKEYWRLLSEQLLPLGIDSWFMDGPEPDVVKPFLEAVTADGHAPTVRNLYPLMHTKNVYEGLRRDQPNKRAFILTRAAFAGQQRNATAVWSGDIGTDFAELKKQIPAGLNFCMAGIPFWTTDIGGYSGGDPADPAYREVFARWWQYGTFCPLFRAHGRRVPTATNQGPNELWAYGEQVQKIGTYYGNLRYRLMPYIYSQAAEVTTNDGTMMRALPFDFAKDTKVLNITDQFMFGPALLVNPVTDAGAVSRKLYLPAGANWFDFWTGKIQTGGQEIVAEAPLETIPLYVRAGSIIPMGPVLQYTDEKPADPIELRVYRGADGAFTLYEDDGTTYDYEKGAQSRIGFSWNEKTKILSIGARQGRFTGMIQNRTFRVIWVRANQGQGIGPSEKADVEIQYSGKAVSVKAPK